MTPPYDLDAEIAILGGILIDYKANEAVDAMNVLQADDFYHPAHVEIYDACGRLVANNEPIDEVTVVAALRAVSSDVSVAEVSNLSSLVPTTANIMHYTAIVREKAQARRLLPIASTLTTEVLSGTERVEEIAEHAISCISGVVDSRFVDDMASSKEVLRSTLHEIQYRYKHRGKVLGAKTGLPDLDQILGGGLQDDELIIIAGRPSMGKTALAIGIAEHVASVMNEPTAIFSLEMSKTRLMYRLLSSVGRVDGTRLRMGTLDSTCWPKLLKAGKRIGASPLFVSDVGAISVQQIRSAVRRLHRRAPLRLVVVDYLQLMGSLTRASSREAEVSAMSRGLKALAMELHCPVIALSQLNRKVEERNDKRPLLSDLRESGAIEQDADTVLLLYRDEYYTKHQCQEPGVAEIDVAKQRNGPTGVIKVRWHGQYTLFLDL